MYMSYLSTYIRISSYVYVYLWSIYALSRDSRPGAHVEVIGVELLRLLRLSVLLLFLLCVVCGFWFGVSGFWFVVRGLL
jgi:hypothetical protein